MNWLYRIFKNYFFAPILKTYENDLSKRWRIEWKILVLNGLASKRMVDYCNINKGQTISERIALAELLIKNLNFKNLPISVQQDNELPLVRKNILAKAFTNA